MGRSINAAGLVCSIVLNLVVTAHAQHTIRANFKSGEIAVSKFEVFDGTNWIAIPAPDTGKIAYSGLWLVDDCDRDSVRLTEDPNAYCEMSFEGSGIRLYTGPGFVGSSFEIVLNGVVDSIAARIGGWGDCNELIYERTNLDPVSVRESPLSRFSRSEWSISSGGKLVVQLPEGGASGVGLYSLSGKLMAYTRSHSHSASLPVNRLPRGNYLLRTKSAGTEKGAKVVLQ